MPLLVLLAGLRLCLAMSLPPPPPLAPHPTQAVPGDVLCPMAPPFPCLPPLSDVSSVLVVVGSSPLPSSPLLTAFFIRLSRLSIAQLPRGRGCLPPLAAARLTLGGAAAWCVLHSVSPSCARCGPPPFASAWSADGRGARRLPPACCTGALTLCACVLVGPQKKNHRRHHHHQQQQHHHHHLQHRH